MKRFPLMAASAAIGLALLAGTTRELTAESSAGPVPPLSGSCYYFMYSCAYDDGSYWSGCETGGSGGMIPTSAARIICSNYNAH